jgi:hypothetical protein
VGWHKPQMATSMRRRMEMSTRTREAVGTRHRVLLNPPQAIPAQTRLQLKAMEHSQGVLSRRHLAEAEEVVVGNPGRPALVVRRAAVAAAAGAVAGKAPRVANKVEAG